MRDRRWVVNASPLILLGKISQLPLLVQLTSELAIPRGVVKEIYQGPRNDPARKWLKGLGKEYLVRMKSVNVKVASWDLGLRESEVLSYVIDNPGFKAIVDDAAARTCALNLNIPFGGTVGIILLAKKEALIPEITPLLSQLQVAGIRLSSELIATAKKLANEE